VGNRHHPARFTGIILIPFLLPAMSWWTCWRC